MPNLFDERWEGPIRGLRLPLRVWNTLMEEGITTLDQLRAVAHQLECLPGIGPKMARVTREELARASAP
jgi:endonuclease III